jgi:hypothetical protein
MKRDIQTIKKAAESIRNKSKMDIQINVYGTGDETKIEVTLNTPDKEPNKAGF